MNYYSRICCLMILTCVVGSFAVGQSAVITLVFPSGSRSLAMGEVGTALADDEDVLFYNPAGLGIPNQRWDRGAGTNFFEQLLPAFKIPDLWHGHSAILYQPESPLYGGYAVDLNYLNFGLNTSTDELGNAIAQYMSYEYVLSAAWGFSLEEIGIHNHFFGVALKLINSALAPGIGPNGEGTARSYAVDFGYIWRFLPYMRFGLTFANMGPSVYYINSQESDPIPFTINLAFAYKNTFMIKDFHFLDVNAEVRAEREIVKNYPDKQPDPFYVAMYTGLLNDKEDYPTLQSNFKAINLHAGAEVTFANTGSIRWGLLSDVPGQRFEAHLGFGFRVYDHIQWDFSYIYAPEGFMKNVFPPGANGARDGQISTSITFFRVGSWSAKDGKWFLKP
ncbi:MAG TPA: PorV/PorQ family protein [Chitinivibrionales bacterium]|jgi:hypothetical protein|nr:PorV/PorQ family protein [Chitinivibrionales bacterium]